jgi:hypothetical protein
MMNVDPREIGELLGWLTTFEATTWEHRGQFGLDPEVLDEIRKAREALQQAHGRVEASARSAEIAAHEVEAARDARDGARERGVGAQQYLAAAEADRLAAQTELASRLDALFERVRRREAGIAEPPVSLRASVEPSVPSASTLSAPRTPGRRIASLVPGLAVPTQLTVTPQPGRAHLLHWNGNNPPGTTFAIELAVGSFYRGSPMAPGPGDYKRLTALTETTYQHPVGQISKGSVVKYRIRAERGGAASPYSAEVTIECK